MAKSRRTRTLPRTPVPTPARPESSTGADGGLGVASGGPHDAERVGTPSPGPRKVAARRVESDPEYLVKGTGCTDGHERGRELETRRLGRVPSARLTRLGFGLVLWCFAGALFLAQGRYSLLALELMVLWLALSAIVQRRAGHRGRCWRTRAWRHAWGGLVPAVQPRSTRA